MSVVAYSTVMKIGIGHNVVKRTRGSLVLLTYTTLVGSSTNSFQCHVASDITCMTHDRYLLTLHNKFAPVDRHIGMHNTVGTNVQIHTLKLLFKMLPKLCCKRHVNN